MKQTLLILIIAAGLVGCKDKKYYKIYVDKQGRLIKGATNGTVGKIIIRSHACIYNPCPHITKDSFFIR